MRDLAAAFTLLTRLPAWRLTRSAGHVPIVRAVWAFPLVGAVVGGIGAAAFAICTVCHMPASLGAVWALAAMLLVTGGLHEDGLADTADGLGGGRTRARKLEIMRDSRIGVFGASALLLTLAARIAAIAEIGRAGQVAAALVAAGALGRGCILLMVLASRPARTDGLGAGLHARAPTRIVVGIIISGLITLALLPASVAIRAAAAAVAGTLALGWTARCQLGGYTGDVLGAASVLAESLAISQIAGGVGTR